MSKSAHAPGWLRFFKPKYDFFSLLSKQASTTMDGVNGFKDWLVEGAQGECRAVHETEHQADIEKSNIEQALAATIVTPFDREEIYDLSARLDLIIDGLKHLVKDMECIGSFEIDQHMIEMSESLAHGTQLVVHAIDYLEKDIQEVMKAADKARKTEMKFGKAYRHAMKELYEQDDVRQLVKTKSVYDSLARVSERIEQIGEKLLHLSTKMA